MSTTSVNRAQVGSHSHSLARRESAEAERRKMHSVSQVGQYSRNSLIKQRVRPSQTLLDFSLAQRSIAEITLHTGMQGDNHTRPTMLVPKNTHRDTSNFHCKTPP
ncbi:unnamed protein product [Pleuronectes platessa]|uniref:Uncharacterized protein n=1 Tax=Pleuronectes platessa TaxID=8262 RepID=A0A9N7TS79_PLEPL|nr:unnamed protein product [Pleuronectes platessa]